MNFSLAGGHGDSIGYADQLWLPDVLCQHIQVFVHSLLCGPATCIAIRCSMSTYSGICA